MYTLPVQTVWTHNDVVAITDEEISMYDYYSREGYLVDVMGKKFLSENYHKGELVPTVITVLDDSDLVDVFVLEQYPNGKIKKYYRDRHILLQMETSNV